MSRTAWSIIAASCMVSGCTAPREPLEVTNPDPSIKIPAIKVAAGKRDHKAEKQLVEDLESDDPAVRFYAIDALHKMTGETFGYVYYDDEEEREPAVKRWRAWLSGSRNDTAAETTTQPASTQPQ